MGTPVVFLLATLLILCLPDQHQCADPVLVHPWWLTLDSVNTYINDIVQNVNSTDCSRPCVKDERRICYKKLIIENYQSMGAACGNCANGDQNDCHRPQCVPTDGFEKGILTFNRELPGPMINVCWKDLIVMDVINKMHSETFSIHWHGQLQRQSPYMDGVPYATQCPILPLSSFRYTFYADDYGTFFYHSHSGLQRYNGAYGGLVVRLPRLLDPLAIYYEEDLIDHAMVLTDWSHDSVEMFFMGLPTRQPGLLPHSILIDGKGRFFNDRGTVQAMTPYKMLYVTSGKKYRIRVVNAGSAVCPILFQVQSHRMQIVSTDGDDVVPEMFDSFMIHTGERYDFILHANQKIGLYWIQARLIGPCEDRNIFQTAVLSYQAPGSLAEPPSAYNLQEYPRGVMLGDHDLSLCKSNPNSKCLIELKSLNPPSYVNNEPDQRFYLRFMVQQLNTSAFFALRHYKPFFNIRNDEIFLATINGISNKAAKYPIISQRDQIDVKEFCNEMNLPDHCKEWDGCICTHVVNLRKNRIIEFVLIDESESTFPVSHPIHLHGIRFVVMSQTRKPGTQLNLQRVKLMEENNELKVNGTFPVMKDTVVLQNQGVVVIRFIADNPGPWFIHCHIEDHMAFGMAMLMLIEGELPPKPKGWPVCGPFP